MSRVNYLVRSIIIVAEQHSISISLSRDSRLPSLHYPPLTLHRFSELAYSAGIEAHQIDGVSVKIYSPEKTLADCFKFRNKIGMDLMLEALKRTLISNHPDQLRLAALAQAKFVS